MGKSTYLRRLSRDDLEAGRGLLLVDPHGDLAEQVKGDVPRRRKNDLFFLDATDPSNARGLNPLRNTEPSERSLIVSNLVATMKKLWPEFWGPRMEHVLRYTLLALLEVRDTTLEDVVGMLVDDVRRRSILRHVTDPLVQNFWNHEFAGYGKQFAAEVVAPVLNKVGALLASAAVRALVTKRRPKLDARRVLDQGRLLVASLPKGRIGEDASLLLGGLLLGVFAQAATGRADLPLEQRTPFSVVIDEVASFATAPFVGFVTESRKYGVGLTLATQTLAGLDASLRATLLGNVGTIVTFRVGAEDAELLSKELLDVFSPHALQSLDVGEHVTRRGARRPVLVPPLCMDATAGAGRTPTPAT